MLSPTERFSSRVADYVRYRPSYPSAAVDFILDRAGLSSDSVIADIGCGTGILARLFLERGHRVIGVEPNAPMREASAALLAGFDRFLAVDGRAEAIGLPDRSTSLITAGQAFHWFEVEAARLEFHRILKPPGAIALIWNDRRIDSTPFLRDYERFLHTYGEDYAKIAGEQIDHTKIARLFAPGGYETGVFAHSQVFGSDELKGRLLSCSYAPQPGHARHEAMISALGELFAQYEQGGHVAFEYDTRVYLGRM